VTSGFQADVFLFRKLQIQPIQLSFIFYNLALCGFRLNQRQNSTTAAVGIKCAVYHARAAFDGFSAFFEHLLEVRK